MKTSQKLTLGIAMLLFLITPIYPQGADLIRHCAIPSPEGKDSIRFGLVLPVSYNDGPLEFPVVYYLHGMNNHYAGVQSFWIADFFKTGRTAADIIGQLSRNGVAAIAFGPTKIRFVTHMHISRSDIDACRNVFIKLFK